ncbi:hypothetical protein [Brevibacillus sp. NRS-1366]|uniref:hypothetical protein n=1 Tax=Brevibacillus sp. NRS-1366 TaxID=3233899 RepID=UPI003D2440D3
MLLLENKSIYYPVSWDDAADYTRAMEAMGIPHLIEDPSEGLPIQQGQLAIVFPHLPVRQYEKVRTLFNGDGEHYPD